MFGRKPKTVVGLDIGSSAVKAVELKPNGKAYRVTAFATQSVPPDSIVDGAIIDSEAVAHAIACACLGNNHLWQDLALPSRAELSALIATWFPTLAALNHQNMKWKKFFYKQLCLRHELFICRAPSCAVCADQGVCFGPE